MVALVLLPGMDGAGTLLNDFVSKLGPGLETTIVSYPADRALGYSELERLVRSSLPADRPYFLLAESFSGPIAISIGASPPAGLLGLILCCSFARNPRRIFNAAWPLLRPLSPNWLPTWLLSAALLGRFASPPLPAMLRQSVAALSAPALRARIQAVIDVDLTHELPKLRVPLLYLRASEDRIIPPSCSEAIARAAPRVQIVEIEGPHMLLQVSPSAAAAAVTDFIRATTAPAARET